MQNSVHLTPHLDEAFAQICDWPAARGGRTFIAIGRSAQGASLDALRSPEGIVGFLLLPAEMGELGTHGRELMVTVLARGGTMVFACSSHASALLHLTWLKWCGVTVQHLPSKQPAPQHV